MIELKPRKVTILIFLACILFALFFIGILIRNLIEGYSGLEALGTIIISIGLILFASPPLLLSITYFYTDLTKKVFLDESRKQIVIRKRGKETVITQSEIMDSFYVKADDFYSGLRHYRFPMYKYIMLILKERKRVCITNLLCEPEIIIRALDINCKLIYTDFPFIKWTLGSGVLTTKEFETKVQEFENNFQGHANSILTDIISQKKVYADYAREAATRILNKRKH
jgi:hypothetical protein